MARERQVNRPTKRTEYRIVAATAQADKGWRDLVATHRNLTVDTWEFLTAHPLKHTPTNYPLRGELGTITRNGCKHARWQHKPSQGNGARIWFYVADNCVYLEKVHTHHPNETS
ncbi:hypothetical protein G7067_10440 [Leucobacter insecticola]|uniref:Cytotoxic translational repressor of toxin-antitoxin stability system n=1 Tax=Leucobacter insecticola TaxID=2714934 RepID=A0A6G8FJV9_9MICO|nr:hypothetical protein G7067_10440 [Leucobacter insecticola]